MKEITNKGGATDELRLSQSGEKLVKYPSTALTQQS
jgi:hypothetical protein